MTEIEDPEFISTGVSQTADVEEKINRIQTLIPRLKELKLNGDLQIALGHLQRLTERYYDIQEKVDLKICSDDEEREPLGSGCL